MAQPGVEGLRGREGESELITIELGPDQAPLTLLPEETARGRELSPNVLRSLRPTAYCVPFVDSMQLEHAVDENPDEYLTFSNFLVRAAYQEAHPVYVIGGHMPDILRDVNPDMLRKVNHVPRLLAAGTLVALAGHVATPSKPETQTRRDFLKGTALLGAAAALYTSLFPGGPDVNERFKDYSDEDQEMMSQWYKTLRGFSNLVLACKLHEIAKRHGGGEGEHVLALVPPSTDGLRAALQVPAVERQALVLDFLKNVLEPIAEANAIDREEYVMLLRSIAIYVEARPMQDSPTPAWQETEYPAFPLY